MVTLNRKAVTHTFEGAVSNRISDIEQLRRSVMGCLLWEKTFYEEGISVSNRIETLVKSIPNNEAIEKIAIEAKTAMKLRHVPLYLAVLLAEKGHNVRKLIPNIVNRVDDMAELIALYWRNGKKPLSRSLIRGVADSFDKFDEYQFAKYSGSNKDAIRLVDVINLTHPKPKNETQRELFKKIVKGSLKTPETWEVSYSRCKSTIEKCQVWQDLVAGNKIGGLATLRNIRNMEDVGFDGIDQAVKNINCKKLLPINFIKSALVNPKYENILEDKFFETFEVNSFERIKGSTTILIDVSRSMSGEGENRVSGLAMIAREMFESINFLLFADNVYQIPAWRGFALRDLCLSRSESTNLGYAVSEVNKIKNMDRLIVLTDEQSSSRVPNPVCEKAYMVNIATYQNGIGYNGGWVHIDGWSDTILKYITEYERG